MKEKILIADDNADIRSMLKVILEPAGFQCILAEDGMSGLEFATQHCPDLILLDVNMPRMDGLEMLRRLRETVCRAPVILVTADADLQVALDAFRLGVKDYMLKPFAPEDVLTTVNRVLESVRLEKERIRLIRQLVATETVQQTAGTLAHHINNALMSLGGNLYILLEMARQNNYPQEMQSLLQEGINDAREIARVLKQLQNTITVKPKPYFGDTTILEIEPKPAKAASARAYDARI